VQAIPTVDGSNARAGCTLASGPNAIMAISNINANRTFIVFKVIIFDTPYK
jgi:hypothetical protein